MKQQKKFVLRKPPPQFSVPGTKFTVDWHCTTFPEYIHSFLSHAHEDHLSGIRSFRPPRILHCTEITAKMLIIKVPQIKPCIQICQSNSSFIVEDVTVHVLDANHTPGSAMFIFELNDGKRILHTGDFRAEPSVVKTAKQFAPIDHLFIDCTYACKGINIPTRKECVDFITERMRDLTPKGYFTILGTYTIGKEDLIFDVAEFTSSTVYAPETRMKTLRDLANTGWRKDDILVDDPLNATIHVLPIGSGSSLEGAIEYAKSIGKTKVLSFSASGWNGRGFWNLPQSLERDGVNCIAYGVPYSDHSSPSELISFVQTMKPAAITPTTGDNPKMIEKINKLFLPYIRKASNKKFIDFWMTEKKNKLPPPPPPTTEKTYERNDLSITVQQNESIQVIKEECVEIIQEKEKVCTGNHIDSQKVQKKESIKSKSLPTQRRKKSEDKFASSDSDYY